MNKGLRNLHLFSIMVHVGSIAFFSWAAAVLQQPGWLAFVGWSAFFGAKATTALRKKKKPSIEV